MEGQTGFGGSRSAMRYAAPVAMPAGLGEWLGAELEARGVEAASLYARAVLSILLHSEVAEAELELDPETQPAWNPRAAFELELRLERHTKETRRGRPSKKNFATKSCGTGHHLSKRSSNMATNNGRNQGQCATPRRRPHSWNGDEEALKKCAAIECLLSATDDGQWGPVEKLVDELCARLKLLQLEQNGGASCGDGHVKQRWTNHGSAPECFEAASSSSDSDSFTSVSSPEGGDPAEHYRQAFPPLEILSDSDQSTQLVTEPIWNVRKSAEKTQQTRVRFVRMPGTRLSPPPNPQLAIVDSSSSQQVEVYGESCASEAYFGDCSRDSSLERAPTPPVNSCTANSNTKGRLYERGSGFDGEDGAALLSDVLNNAFKSFCQLHEDEYPVLGSESPVSQNVGTLNDWKSESDWSHPVGDASNIWAPVESDWALMGPEPTTPWLSDLVAKSPADTAVQLSLALLNHHPEKSGFSPVLARSLQKALPKSSKLLEWLANLATNGEVGKGDPDNDEHEVEHILKETERPDDEEEENLLTSPKTHFCPIQQEGDVEVQVSDGATFDVDAQPEEVHFLRSPSGALYLPDCEESGDGWKGWAKYMIYKLPASPSPLTLTSDQTEQEQQTSRSATPFTLKFRVVQTEKCCQTDSRLSINPDKLPSVTPRAIYPFSASLTTSHGLLDVGDVWKFDAEAVTKELKEDLKGEDELGGRDENEEKELISGKEEEMDGLLNEVWNVATTLNHDGDDEELVDGGIISPSGDVLEAAVDIDQVPDVKVVMVPAETVPVTTAPVEEDVNECNLDELWDPFVDESGRVDQVDVCEWIPQSYGLTDDGCEQWADPDALAESWPPPNIPVEYLDDEFFEEIYGSLDSMKASETASGAGKNSRRRRRRTSQKHQTVRRPKRPCSFFVEGECRRPDCKFSHDLGSIPCRFWIESSCFKGEECPFLHGLPVSDNSRDRNRSCSDAELSESCGSEDAVELPHKFGRAGKSSHGRKKFQFDLEADFPSLSQAKINNQTGDPKPTRSGAGPLVSQSRPIAITQGFAAADHTSTTAGSSLENGAGELLVNSGLKRRRKRFPCQRVSAFNFVGTSTESSPGETVSINVVPAGKRSRKVAKVTLCTTTAAYKRQEKVSKRNVDAIGVVTQSERRRTKSEHDNGSVIVVHGGIGSRLRLSSSYKEG